MSSLRSPRLLLLSPWAYDTGFKTHVVDGDIYELWARATELGISCHMVDGHHRAMAYPDLDRMIEQDRPDVVLAHLWTADNYGEVLQGQCQRLAQLRTAARVPIVAFGYLAVTAADDILRSGAVDAVRMVDGYRVAEDPHPLLSSQTQPGSTVTKLLGAAPDTVGSLWALPDGAFQAIGADTVFSVRASRGCRARCSFCSYNADVGAGWYPRDPSEVADDIAFVVDRVGVRRVALSDADFGGSQLECRMRARALRDELEHRGVDGRRVKIALATRPSTLSEPALADFAAAGVDTILVGVESLDERNLHGVFTKRHGWVPLNDLAASADRLGVHLVASYILWHPWQTLQGLRSELDLVLGFGRHRIPQFLARSVLQVQPGTPVERRLAGEGLLTSGPFHRGFQFRDPAVSHVFKELRTWYEAQAAPVLQQTHEDEPDAFGAIARLKLEELDVLADLLGVSLS